MKNMKSAFASVGIMIAVFSFLALATWWNVSLWNECRQTNSFWYCVRIMAR